MLKQPFLQNLAPLCGEQSLHSNVCRNWETMANIPKFAPVKQGIEKGLKNLHKWYMVTDQTNIYFICLGKYIS